jgi:hypothetical protein
MRCYGDIGDRIHPKTIVESDRPWTCSCERHLEIAGIVDAYAGRTIKLAVGKESR